MQSNGANSTLSPVVDGDTALSINTTQYKKQNTLQLSENVKQVLTVSSNVFS